MEQHTDDVLLAEYVLGSRRPLADEVGPIAGRLMRDFDAMGKVPVQLATRYAIALTCLAAALEAEGKRGLEPCLQFAAGLWEDLVSIPVAEGGFISIGQATFLLPFSAFQYAILVHDSLGNLDESERLRELMERAIALGKTGPLVKAVTAWQTLSASR